MLASSSRASTRRLLPNPANLAALGCPPAAQVKLYFDGEERKPFWVSKAGEVQVRGGSLLLKPRCVQPDCSTS